MAHASTIIPTGTPEQNEKKTQQPCARWNCSRERLHTYELDVD